MRWENKVWNEGCDIFYMAKQIYTGIIEHVYESIHEGCDIFYLAKQIYTGIIEHAYESTDTVSSRV